MIDAKSSSDRQSSRPGESRHLSSGAPLERRSESIGSWGRWPVASVLRDYSSHDQDDDLVSGLEPQGIAGRKPRGESDFTGSKMRGPGLACG